MAVHPRTRPAAHAGCRGRARRSRGRRPARAGPVVIVAGRANLAESTRGGGHGRCDAVLAACPGAKVLPALRRGNVVGALAARACARRGWPRRAGSSAPRPPARSSASCCSAPTRWPTSPTPIWPGRRWRARRASSRSTRSSPVARWPTSCSPAAASARRRDDHEPRRPGHHGGPEGHAGRHGRPDWMIAAELAELLGYATWRRSASVDDDHRRDRRHGAGVAGRPRRGAATATATACSPSPPADRRHAASTASQPATATATTTASWSAARCTTSRRHGEVAVPRPVWRRRATPHVHPLDLDRLGVDRRHRRKAHRQRAARSCSRPCAATPCVPRGAVGAVQPARHRASASSSIADRRCIDVRVERARDAGCSRSTRCSSAISTLDAVRHRRCSRSSSSSSSGSSPRCSWSGSSARSSPACRTASGPNKAGPFGMLQTLADGIKLFFKEDLLPGPGRPLRVPARAVPRVRPGVPGVVASSRSAATSADGNDGIVAWFGHADAGAARRPADRHPVRARAVVDRRLRHHARRLVVRVEVPAARLGAGVGADGQLRGRARAQRRRGAAGRRHAVDARHRRRPGHARRTGTWSPPASCRS